MPTLVSPGVAVSVIDQSAYVSAGQGTVPLIVMATQQDKTLDGATAEGTLAVNADKPILVGSQRELVELFGNPQFKIVDGTPVHGYETNEFGLLAAYSFLGLANRAYVIRADVDTAQLEATSTEPTGDPENGTYWFDLANTKFGIFEASATGTADWVAKNPTIISSLSQTTGGLGVAPLNTIGANGDYAVVTTNTNNQYFKKVTGAWVQVTNAGLSKTVFAAPHYSIPTATAAGDVWIKTTTPNSGLNVSLKKFNSTSGQWTSIVVPSYAGDTAAATGFGSSLAEGKVYAQVAAGDAQIVLRIYTSGSWSTLVYEASSTAPVGDTVDGTLWFNDNLVADLYERTVAGWTPVAGAVTIDSIEPTSPVDGDIWIDSSDTENYPVIYKRDSGAWVLRDNADQTTPNGVVFADLTVTAADTTDGGAATLVDDEAPDPAFYPEGMLCWNAIISTGNVKRYNATGGYWQTESGNYDSGPKAGAPYMLRKAQRRVIVKRMQAAVASNDRLREETIYYNLIAAPGYPELLDEMITLNSDCKETKFIVVDSPMRLQPRGSDLVDWITGVNAGTNGEDGLTSRIFSSAVYYPSVLTTDLSGNDVVQPASHAVLRTIAYNDQVAYPWFAPAGLTRGVITNASNIGYVNSENEFVAVALTNGQRDTLYANRMNPLANFRGQGLFVFGQKTLHTQDSALDRVNVARLVGYLRERFEPLARSFIFEPNDKITRANIKLQFDRFLGDIVAKRGIYDFLVVCDETNNTPARIDRNELYVDVAIEPVKAAEFIYIPIRLVNTGALSGTV